MGKVQSPAEMAWISQHFQLGEARKSSSDTQNPSDFFLGSAYIYTSRFYVQHVPRINLYRSPTLFMQKLTFTDFFLEKLSYRFRMSILINTM